MTGRPLNSDCKDILSSCESVELNTASQNICLTGVYVTNTPKCFERCRGIVVKSKNHKLLPLTDASERVESVYFTSKEGADKFLHDLSNFGYSAALQNHKCDVDQNQSGDLHTFCRIFLFHAVNIRKWIPDETDFSLSRLAIRSLKDIEKRLTGKDADKKSAEDDCISFFEMFGTHVHLTHAILGGIFLISAQTTLDKHEDIESIKNIIQQVHIKDISTESTVMNEDAIEKYLSQKKIEITYRKLGGPQNMNYFTEWKSKLLKNSETWTVSDMGEISFENCIGIWHFVRRHHRSFSNAEQLSCFLAKTWLDRIAHGDTSNLVSDSLWKTFIKGLESTLSESCDASHHLQSLRELLHLLENHVKLVGKAVVTKVVDMFSETSVQTLFKDSAKHENPQNICFQILTTKLKILQIDNDESSAIRSSWIKADYFIPGLLSPKQMKKEIQDVEELLDLLESELLPGMDALEKYCGIDLKKVQSLAKSELLNTIQNCLQRLLDRKKYQEALLLLTLFISIGYHFKRKGIMGDITFDVLAAFTASAKREIALARKYKEDETRDAWLLLEIIFKLDTSYRLFDASIVLANEVNDFVGFLKGKGFVFNSNIEKVIYSEHSEPHGIIHSLAKICRFPCEVFDNVTMRTLHAKNPECCPDKTNSVALSHMIKTFGMEKLFPKKLSTEDVLKLSDTLFTSPKTLKEIPWAIFRRAIAIDYNFRENVLSDFLKKSRTRVQTKTKKEKVQHAKKYITKEYNPMDVFLALWYCCDPFLKKILAAKIATCKLALPLIHEDITTKQQLTISLWPIRDIFIDDSPDSVLTKSLKTVGFVRIGDLKSISKSKIINKFLRVQNNEHNTFYHRDCTLASNKRLVSNGLVEITWYVPRKDNDGVHSIETEEVLEELTQPICILNLRGDAKDFSSQLLALLALSDVVVVMSEFEYLNDEQSLQVLKQVHSSSAFAIIMTDFPEDEEQQDMDENDEEGKIEKEQDQEEEEREEDSDDDNEEHDQKEETEKDEGNDMSFEDNLQLCYETRTGLNPRNASFLSTLNRGKTLNESDLKDCLTTQIISALKHIKFPQSLERKKSLLPIFVAIDEDDANSKYGSDLSETIFADVEYPANLMHRQQIKDKILPLQGENLWHKWCLEQKHCFRSGKKSVSDNVDRRNLMKTLRLWQVMCCLENQNTFVNFVNVLERHIDDREIITYFLQWMKFHMDCHSRQIIPKLSNDLFEAFTQYEKLRSQGDTDIEKVENLKTQMKSAEEKLARASFGLEHFFLEKWGNYMSPSCIAIQKCEFLCRIIQNVSSTNCHILLPNFFVGVIHSRSWTGMQFLFQNVGLELYSKK